MIFQGPRDSLTPLPKHQYKDSETLALGSKKNDGHTKV